jgi:hypothetical protein
MTETLTIGKLVEIIGQLELRILRLEQDSHPPVDLTPFIEREVEEQIARKLLL